MQHTFFACRIRVPRDQNKHNTPLSAISFSPLMIFFLSVFFTTQGMVLSDGLAARLSEDLGAADTLEKELVDAEDDLAAAKEVMRLYEPVARRGAVLMQVATKLIQVGRRTSSSKVRHFFPL